MPDECEAHGKPVVRRRWHCEIEGRKTVTVQWHGVTYVDYMASLCGCVYIEEE